MLYPNDRSPLGRTSSDRTGAEAATSATASTPIVALFGRALQLKWSIIGAALLGLVTTGLALCFVTPHYKAEAVVIVDSRHDKLAAAESPLSEIVLDQYQMALKSELALIESPALATKVITSLNLLNTREFAAAFTHTPVAGYFEEVRHALVLNALLALRHLGVDVDLPQAPPQPAVPGSTDGAVMQNAVKIFSKHLEAVNDPKSLTLRISYASADPRTAAAVANAVLDGYLDGDTELKRMVNQRSEAWLRSRITALRTNLEAAEHAAEDFRARNDLATIRDRAPLEEELLELKKRRIDAQNQVAAAQSRAQRAASGDPSAFADDSDVLNSRLMASLRQMEAQLVAQKSSMLATHHADDLSMLPINEQLASVQTDLRREIQRFAQASVETLHTAQARLNDLNTQIYGLQIRIDVANIADIRMRSLEQDANSARSVLDDFTKRLNQSAGAPLALPDSRVASRAMVPVDPVSPHYGLTLLAGMLGFAAAAFAIGTLRERLGRGFTTARQLGDELGLSVVGLVPTTTRLTRGNEWMARREAMMRDIVVTIRALAHQTPTNPAAVILVTSALAGEGKSTVALSFARNLAAAGRRCLLIDGDVRQPSLHTTLQVPATPGLVDLTLDLAPLPVVICGVASEPFDFLPVGRPHGDTLSPLTTDRFAESLAELRQKYDVIVIDSPPLLAAESLILCRHADLTLFLVQWRTTRREIAAKATALLRRCSTGPCLAVLTKVSPRYLRSSKVYADARYPGVYQAL